MKNKQTYRIPVNTKGFTTFKKNTDSLINTERKVNNLLPLVSVIQYMCLTLGCQTTQQLQAMCTFN